MNHNELGRWGEALAAKHLLKTGYTIIERNWYYNKAEIDILAVKDNLLVVVEVKTRNSDFFGNPQDFVTSSKIKNLVKATQAYIETHDLDCNVRFDIIAILKNRYQEELKHYEDAFYFF